MQYHSPYDNLSDSLTNFPTEILCGVSKRDITDNLIAKSTMLKSLMDDVNKIIFVKYTFFHKEPFYKVATCRRPKIEGTYDV